MVEEECDDGLVNTGTAKVARFSLLSAIDRLGRSFRGIALPLFVVFSGFEEAFYGIIVAAAGYTQAVFLFPAGHLSDKKGRGVSILLGGLISGTALFLLPFFSSRNMMLILYGITGIGSGFMSTSVSTLLADYTERGEERTQSYGYTTTIAILTGIVGSFVAGLILDTQFFQWIDAEIFRYVIVFAIMGIFRFATGITGFMTERWLQNHEEIEISEPTELDNPLPDSAENDAKTATLFGIGRIMMGFSSGLVVPYLILWIDTAFTPAPSLLGSINSLSSLTLATGTLAVGLTGEKVGKLKMITFLYILAPILMFGMVNSSILLLCTIFYISRMAAANMARPARSSLLMEHLSAQRRGKSLAVTSMMWNVPRQTGTLLGALGMGLFGGIVTFGRLFFPIALVLYPLSVIPAYIAVRRNERIRQTHQLNSEDVT
ncbi:MAG: MFS transporter [Promethearchaeia archaeon]